MFIYYIKRMLHFIKKCIHGIIVHPILPFLPIKLSKRIHNSNSAWVWGKKNRDIWLIDEDFDKFPVCTRVHTRHGIVEYLIPNYKMPNNIPIWNHPVFAVYEYIDNISKDSIKDQFKLYIEYALCNSDVNKDQLLDIIYNIARDLYENDNTVSTSVSNNIIDKINGINFGGKTDYYNIPPGAKAAEDIIRYRKMCFFQGEIFKAAFCFNTGRHSGNEGKLRDLQKIKYYSEKLIDYITKESK